MYHQMYHTSHPDMNDTYGIFFRTRSFSDLVLPGILRCSSAVCGFSALFSLDGSVIVNEQFRQELKGDWFKVRLGLPNHFSQLFIDTYSNIFSRI